MPGFGFGFGAHKGHRGALSKVPAVPATPLSPSASWDGTAGSGFSTVPSDPVRTTAKPTCHLIVLPAQFFTDELEVGVAAWANNNGSLYTNCGLNRVTFHFEGEQRQVASPGFKTITDANGVPRSYFGWWVKLKKPEGIQGEAQLYVEAVPADATMQSRVIGPYSFFPHDVFPATGTLHDYELEIAPSQSKIVGQRYQDVRDAMNYLWSENQSGTVLNPRLTFTEGGTMDITTGFYVQAIPGWVTCEATLPITFSQPEANRDLDDWFRPKLGSLRWRGANITFDFANAIVYYPEANHRVAFECVNLTNSRGRDALYRKGPPNQSGLVRQWAWFTECNISNVQNPCWNSDLVRGCTIIDCINDAFVNAKCVIDTDVDTLDNDHLAVDVDALSVQYTGAGATATLSGDLSTNNRVFTAKVDGAIVGTFTVGGQLADFNTGTNYDVQDVADWLNSLADWTASVLDDTRRAQALSPRGNRGADFFDVDVRSAPVTLATHFDLHSDWYQHNYGVLPENVLVSNSTGIGLRSQGVLLNPNSPERNDYLFINNALAFKFDDPTGEYDNANAYSQFNGAHSHVVFAHCTWAGQGLLLRTDQIYAPDSYCLLANNVLRSITWVGPADPELGTVSNHLYTGFSAPEGSVGTTSGGDQDSLFADYANGDFEPAGDLLTTPAIPTVRFDRNKNLRGGLVPIGSDARSSPPILAALLLSSADIVEAAPAGAYIGKILGASPGSIITLHDDAGGRFALIGDQLVTGAIATDYETDQSHSVTLRETHTRAKNSPRDTVISIQILNLGGLALATLSLDNASVAETSAEGTIVGNLDPVLPGSTLIMTDSAEGRFALSGNRVVTGPTALDFETGDSHTITVQEANPDAANSPVHSTIAISVIDEAEEPPAAPPSDTLPKEPASSISYITTLSGSREADLGVPDEYWTGVGDQEAAMDMSLTGTATRMTAQDGRWSESATWVGGNIPAAGEVAHIMHEVIYDASTPVGGDSLGEIMAAIEADDAAAQTTYAPFALKGVMVMTGARLRFDPAVQTFLLTESLFAMGGSELEIGNAGNPVLDSGVTHAGLRVPRAAIGLIGLADPGASMRLGMVTMGKLRLWGEAKTVAEFAADITAGQTTLTMDAAPTNWRVGDRILVPGTAFSALSASDSRYTGPTTFWGPEWTSSSYGDMPNSWTGQQTNQGTLFKSQGQDEIKVITAISGTTVTVDSAFAYNHTNDPDTLYDGAAVTLKFPVQNLSRSIGVFGFCTDEKGSGAHRRPHTMQMFHDDAVRKWAEFKDLGRSRPDPSQTSPGSNDASNGLRVSDGGAFLADPDNVIGRYAVHDHWTGPFFARRAVISEGLSMYNTPGTVSGGRGYVQHNSRSHLHSCIAHGFRATGFFTEMGTEIGQWVDCYSSNHPGDGYQVRDFGDRHELIGGMSGHNGVAYQNEARQVINEDCWAGSCNVQYNWRQNRAPLFSAHSPDHRNLRYVDPLTMGNRLDFTRNALGTDMVDYIGHQQVQIPQFNGNTGHDGEDGFVVGHRNEVDGLAVEPMVSEGIMIKARRPFNIPNYTFNYWFKDFLFIGDGGNSAIRIGTKTYALGFSNGRVRNFSTVIRDVEFNYHGALVDIAHDGVSLQATVTTNLSYASAASHPQNGVMGPWTQTGTQGNGDAIVRLRDYTILDSATDLPAALPAAPFNVGAAAGSAVPRYELDGDVGGTVTPDGRAEVLVHGKVTDTLGNREWPTRKRYLSNGLDDPGDRVADVITGTQIVERNGCWNDAGTWKVTLWFVEADRVTHDILYIPVTCTLSGFDAGFLADHEVADANATKPSFPLALEDQSYSSTASVETDVAPFAFTPVIDVAASTLVASDAMRVDRLTAGESAAVSITGGEYRINGGSWVSGAGTAVRGDEIEVRLTSSATAGASASATLTVGNESAAFVATTLNVVSSISDNFDAYTNGEALSDQADYTSVEGGAGTMIVNNGALNTTTTGEYVQHNAAIGRVDDLRFKGIWNGGGGARIGLFSEAAPSGGVSFSAYRHWDSNFKIETGGSTWTYGNPGLQEVIVELVSGSWSVTFGGVAQSPTSGGTETLPSALSADARVMVVDPVANGNRTNTLTQFTVEHI